MHRMLTTAAALALLSIAPSAPAQAPRGAAQAPRTVGQASRPAGQAAQQPQQASPIAIAPPVVDLGAVEPGSTHPAKFTIVNGGREEITVLAATPNCKCTAISDVAGRKIAPGGTLELSASLAAPRAPGVKEAVVFLTFDKAPPAQAKIKGDVRLKVIAEPAYVDALKEVTSGTVKVRSADGKPFTVSRAGGKDPVYVGFDPKKDAPRAEYTLAWSLAGLTCEEMPIWWFVWTDRVSECPVIPLRVRDECTGSKHDMARMQRFWIVKEQLLAVGATHNGTPIAADLELEHYNPARKGAVERPDWSEVKSVRSLVDGVTVKMLSQRTVPGDATVLKLELVADRGGAFEGELEVETATGKGRVPFTLFATTW